MKLPLAFKNRMRERLGDDFDAFLASYEGPTYTGLRVNTLKISVADFLSIFPYPLEPIPWTEDGFYYREEDQVTKHPLYYAGLYYIQEPSAMSPVTILKPKAGEHVLDLCAAPGGKSIQIAAYTGDTGLLVTNDINDKRVKAIVRNVEKYGLKNVLVLNDDQYAISKALPHFFDKILIDAPCSGEGMFKKDPKAIKAWEAYANEVCAKMQREILNEVPKLVKDETTLVYSTCTFADVENEAQMAYLSGVDEHFEKQDIKSEHFDVTDGVAHLWPHALKGEGHFIGAMVYKGDAEFRESTDRISQTTIRPLMVQDQKSYPITKGDASGNSVQLKRNEGKRDLNRETIGKGKHNRAGKTNKMEAPPRNQILSEAPEGFLSFVKQYLNMPITGVFKLDRDKLYLLPEDAIDTGRLHVARYGWLLGEFKRDKFIPSQALAMGLAMSDFKNVVNLSPMSQEVLKFLKGETLDYDVVKSSGEVDLGYCLICTAGYPLGFIKIESNVIKNLYPISWRMM